MVFFLSRKFFKRLKCCKFCDLGTGILLQYMAPLSTQTHGLQTLIHLELGWEVNKVPPLINA
ncbi:hypothetical protein KsCSTR_15470 [Candidatus Kuenenia stuttgartiensis]|uniref:Uncharacterized protein n=1 Tax=Kuenenia stuttgartiensis TaxID=174633 RepID=Q1Q1M4_KUEST|nr:hypothetical protein KsCSTR_15470 [Candidatus Kuenenia stuttgartiensis]CAJ73902.1 unknown protein [Candidatus Kuenenia stuttgartiensis]